MARNLKERDEMITDFIDENIFVKWLETKPMEGKIVIDDGKTRIDFGKSKSKVKRYANYVVSKMIEKETITKKYGEERRGKPMKIVSFRTREFIDWDAGVNRDLFDNFKAECATKL